jgi:hypothetical protein
MFKRTYTYRDTFVAMTRIYVGKLESHTRYSHIALLQECHDPTSHVTMNTQISKHMCNYPSGAPEFTPGF